MSFRRSHNSTCERGLNEKVGFSPWVRTIGLSSALFPAGTDSWGKLGRRSINLFRASSTIAPCPAAGQPLADEIRFLADQLNIEHRRIIGATVLRASRTNPHIPTINTQ